MGMNSLRNHVLAYICVPLLIIAAVLSFYRFVIARDYFVEYEADCDPTMESCFVGCEDEECTEVYYYAIASKHAADLYTDCGPDITDCENASQCLAEDTDCSLTYCDESLLPADEACASLQRDGVPVGNDAEEPIAPEEL